MIIFLYKQNYITYNVYNHIYLYICINIYIYINNYI